VLVAHAYNASYSGGKDQEDHSLKSPMGKQFSRPNLNENPAQKRASGVAQGPEFKP
jgi:hypothetical protein